MPSRKRRAQSISSSSSISDDDEPRHARDRVYRQEDEVLKPIGQGANQDDYPIYLLEDVTIYSADGKSLGNLLEVDLKGKLSIRGRLVISEEEEEIFHLKRRQYNGQWITFTSQAFSMGWGPSAIWALGKHRWFEILPSVEYQETYAKMAEGISIYYYFTELYEKLGKRVKTLELDEILLIYADLEGNNLSALAVSERIKKHSSFLLAQMIKLEGSVDWPDTKFFQWLTTEFPGIHDAINQKYKLPPPPPAPPSLNLTSRPRTSTNTVSRPEATNNNSASHLPTSSSSPTPLAQLSNDRRLKITSGAPSTTDIILRTMSELSKSFRNVNKISMASVWGAIYQDLQLELPLAKVIVRCHARQVLDSLPKKKWENSLVYQELVAEAALSKPSSEKARNKALVSMSKEERDAQRASDAIKAKEHAEWHQLAMSIELKPRKPMPGRRRPAGKVVNSSGIGGSHTMASPSPTSEASNPQATGSKPISTQLGRGGKNPVLRPTGASTLNATDHHMGDIEPDLNKPDGDVPAGNGGRGRKRKAIEPEMGNTSDSEAILEAAGSAGRSDTEEEVAEEAKLESKLVEVKLPTTQPSGPNGTWVCSKDDCSVVIHDSQSDEGKISIRKHQFSHVDPEVMQYVLEKETKESGVKAKYLIEKIRQLGASKRMEEESEKTSKLQTVKPIKRANI